MQAYIFENKTLPRYDMEEVVVFASSEAEAMKELAEYKPEEEHMRVNPQCFVLKEVKAISKGVAAHFKYIY